MRRSDRRRKRLIVAIIGLCAIAATITVLLQVQAVAERRNLREARVTGLAAFERGEYADALQPLSYVIGRDPTDVEVLLAFAESRSNIPLVNNRHLFESIGHLLTALRHEPGNITALENLLALYERTGRRLEWMTTAENLLNIVPNHTEALRLKAVGHSLVSEFGSALTYTEKLITYEPDDLRWRIFHLQLMRNGDFPRGDILTQCDEWIAGVDSGDGRFHMLKAGYLASVGALEEARPAALDAAARGADSAEVLQQLVSLLEGLRFDAEARELIARTKDRFPLMQWPHEADIRRLWQAGRIDEALARIELVRSERGTIESGMLRWKCILHLHQFDLEHAKNALAVLEERLEQSPDRTGIDQAWIDAIRARIELDTANWDEAIHKYRNAISANPNDAVLHFLAGEAYAQMNEHELAAASLERAVRAEPNWIGAQIYYAESLLRIGRSEAAAQVAVHLLRRAPEPDLDHYLLFARAWMVSGLTAEELGVRGPGGSHIDLREFLHVLRTNTGDHAEVVDMLVHTLLREDDAEAAAEVIEETLAEENPDTDSIIRLARTSYLAQLGYEERLLERAIEQVGLTIDIAEIKARILHQDGRTEEGRQLIESALAEHEKGSFEFERGMRALATFMVQTHDPQAGEILRTMLGDGAGRPDQIAFVLAQPLVWQDASLARTGVDLLADALGESSLRVALARATFILHFERDDRAAMAEALVLVNDVLQRTPDSLGARVLMAALHLESTPPEPEAAIRQLQRAIRAHPRRADLYPQLIALLQQQGDFAAAEAQLHRLSSLSGRDETLLRTEIRLLETQGDFESIIALLSDRLASPSNEADQITLLASYHRAGRQDKADEVATALLSAPDSSPSAIGAVIQFYADAGRIDDAMDLLEEYEEREPAEAALLLGSLHQYIDRTRDAERALLHAAQLAPDDPRVWARLADHYLRLGEHREARQAARSGLQVAPNDQQLATKLVLASLNLDADAQHEALQLLNASDEFDPALAATLHVYSRIASRTDAAPTQRDLADINRLVRDHGRFLPAWRLAIAAHMEAGEIEIAADLAARATSRFPREAEPAELATRALIRLGRTSEALEMARTWRSRSLQRVLTPDAVIASLLVDLGRTKAAIDQVAPHIDRIVSTRADSPEHMRTLLSALALGGEIQRAVEIIQPLHEAGEAQWRDALVALAARAAAPDAARLLGQLEPFAVRDGSATLALAVQWTGLGIRDDRAEHFTRAERLALRAAELDSNLALHSRLIRGSAADYRNDFETAEEHYRRVLELDADNIMALNNLAQILVRRGGDSSEALRLSERAVSLLPDHPDLLDTHAQALLAAGMLQQAEEYAGRALEHRPDDTVALLTLTKVFLAQNRIEEAREAFQRAGTALSTSNSVSQHVRSKYREVEQELQVAHLTSGT